MGGELFTFRDDTIQSRPTVVLLYRDIAGWIFSLEYFLAECDSRLLETLAQPRTPFFDRVDFFALAVLFFIDIEAAPLHPADISAIGYDRRRNRCQGVPKFTDKKDRARRVSVY